jgi:hypothetical protein
MYIPFGRTNSYRTLGRVADFCPLCRGIRPFRLLQVDSIRHFYSIPLGGRTSIGQSRVCETCQLVGPAPSDGYRALSNDPDADLDTLIAETNPEIRRNYASRLILEERIAARKLTAGERSTLLREPFEMAGAVLARRDAVGNLDLPSHLGCLGSLFLPVACLLILPLVWKTSGDSIELAAIAVGGCCLAFTFLAIVTDARRLARRVIVPRLVACLRPLDPSAEEIDEILESMRRARSPLAEVVSPRDLTNALLERWD